MQIPQSPHDGVLQSHKHPSQPYLPIQFPQPIDESFQRGYRFRLSLQVVFFLQMLKFLIRSFPDPPVFYDGPIISLVITICNFDAHTMVTTKETPDKTRVS